MLRRRPRVRLHDESRPANLGTLLLLFVLLAMPVIAVWRLGVDFRWACVYALGLGLLTYWVYAHDKRRAQEGGWRVPEMNLHLLELLGGWPGALLAQRRLRHKSSKGSYLFMFWLIVLVWQFAAFDSLQHWKFSRQVGTLLNAVSDQRK